MDPLKYALRLNNEGVRLLLDGNQDQQAVSCFTESLNQVKQALSAHPDNKVMFSNPPLIHQASFPIPSLHDPGCFVYSNAITFKLDDAFLRSSSHDLHVYSAVIILNIAMAYHRQGVIRGSPACYFKAEKMYDMVTTLVASNEDNLGTSLLVEIAAINNLSQLRHEQGDYDASREGFEYLGALLNLAESQLAASSLNQEDDIFKGIILNVLLVAAPETAPAA